MKLNNFLMVNNNNNDKNHNLCICKEGHIITIINISADKVKTHWTKNHIAVRKKPLNFECIFTFSSDYHGPIVYESSEIWKKYCHPLFFSQCFN